MSKYIFIKTWRIVIVNKQDGIGSEQCGRRPALVLARLKGDRFLIAYISSKIKNFVTHVSVTLKRPSEIMLEQLDTVSLQDIEKVGELIEEESIRKSVKEKFHLSILEENDNKNEINSSIKRGEIVVFQDNNHNEKKGVVIQNNRGNLKSRTTIIFESGEIKTISKERIIKTLGFSKLTNLENQIKNIL